MAKKERNKLSVGVHVMSQSERKRQVITITEGANKKKHSVTHHEIKDKYGDWRRK